MINIKNNLLYFFILVSSIFLSNIIFNNNNIIFADNAQPFVQWKNSHENSYSDDGWSEPKYNSDQIAYVSNANEFLDALYDHKGGESNLNSNGNSGIIKHSNIHKIILTKDISLKDATENVYNKKNGEAGFNFSHAYDYKDQNGNWDWSDIYVSHKNLIIDGQNHTLDMMYNDIAMRNIPGENWTLENMKLLGSSYFGPISVNDPNTTLNYRNIDYYGSQLSWGSNVPKCKTNIYGNVSVHSLYEYKSEYPYGSSVAKYNQYTENNGNQQNFQAGDIEFHKNSNYYGETYNGTCLELYGSAKLDDNANIELHPHGNSAENSPTGTAIGMYLLSNTNGYTSSISTSNNNKINIYCDNSKLTNSDGSSMDPYYSGTIGRGILAQSNTSLNINNGENSDLNVVGNGNINNSDPIVEFSKMNAEIYGNGNTVEIHEDANNQYIPQNGIFKVDDSNINVSDLGSFILTTKNIPPSNNINYMLYSPNSIINLYHPKDVLLNNLTYNSNQDNYLVYMKTNGNWFGDLPDLGGNHYIHTTNVLMSGDAVNPGSRSSVHFSQNPLAGLYLPFSSNVLLDSGVRLLGNYPEIEGISNKMRSLEYNAGNIVKNVSSSTFMPLLPAQEFYNIHFSYSPAPHISNLTKIVNSEFENINGKIIDEYGKPIKNAYLRASLDGHYLQPDSNPLTDDQIIDSKEVLFSPSQQYTPNSGNPIIKTDSSYHPIDQFQHTLSASDFNPASGYFTSKMSNNDINNHSTLNDSDGSKINDFTDYFAVTDENGNFSLKLPISVWKQLDGKVGKLTLHPSYNFVNGPTSDIKLIYKPDVNIKSNIVDLSNSPSNISKYNLSNVYQGGLGHSGDIIQFNNYLQNNAKYDTLNNSSFTQPVPNSIDDKSLEISYDNGKNFSRLKADDYTVTNNSNGVKNINLKNISIKSKNKLSILLRGTLKNSIVHADTNSVKLLPNLNYDGLIYANGNLENISYIDSLYNFHPSNLNYGDTSSIIKNHIMKPIGNYDPVFSINNSRKDNNNFNLSIYQDDDSFRNVNNYDESFNGKLIYHGNDLSQAPSTVFRSDNHHSLWNDERNILLKPENNYYNDGNYKTKVTWILKSGF